MYKQLMELSKRVEEVKKEFRRALLRSLGVDRLVRRAFEEGWTMSKEQTTVHKEFDSYAVDVWRSVDEAFANSDVEEEV